MTKIKICVLTDPTHHTIHNSFYGIVSKLFEHSEVNEVAVISRKDVRNRLFFKGEFENNAYGVILNKQLNFAERHILESGKRIAWQDDYKFLIRLPHPISETFLLNFEKSIGKQKIINQPKGILKVGNKSFLAELDSAYTSVMKVCKDSADIMSFLDLYPKAVLKPLMGYGGKGVLKVESRMVYSSEEKLSLNTFLGHYTLEPQALLAVEFLENVKNGDKRIVVVDGDVISATLRLPKEGGWLCNVSQGGHDKVSEPTSRELEIIEYLSPILRREGILVYGLDTLEDNNGKRVISEINALSPGGITPYERHTGKNITKILANKIVDYFQSTSI